MGDFQHVAHRCRDRDAERVRVCRALVNPSGKSERASGEMTLEEVTVRYLGEGCSGREQAV